MQSAALNISKHLRLFLSILGLLWLAGCTLSSPTKTPSLPTAAVKAGVIPTQTSPPATSAPTSADQQPAPAQAETTEADPAPSPALACDSPAELTPSMTEGPFYTPGSPERTSLLEPGMSGTPLTISGYVLTQECEPIAGAWLDFWQTDAQGEYDNAGYRLRGHQFTRPDGSYLLETVLPGEYPGRTAHIHLKVQAPDGPVLTSQLFFPGSAGNASDAIFSERLLVDIQDGEAGLQGAFNFIVEAP